MTAPDENSSSRARPLNDMHGELYGDVAHAERFLQAEPLAQHIVDWLNQPSLRAERRYLEARTVLIGPTAMQILHALAITYAELPDMVEDVMDHMDLLADIQARGNDAEAIQQAYLNAFGGVVLDAPPWVEEAERQEATIEHNERHAQSSDGAARARVEVWRTALARSRETSTLPSDLRAYILTRLWNALDDTDGPDKAGVQEQGIVCLDRALRIYTRERLPRQ